MSCLKLKSVVVFLKIVVNLVFSRNFGNIKHNQSTKTVINILKDAITLHSSKTEMISNVTITHELEILKTYNNNKRIINILLPDNFRYMILS